jgi:hypothetical protein
MFKCTLVVMLASLFADGAVFAEDRGTPEQRAAYAPGAFWLCASYIADAIRAGAPRFGDTEYDYPAALRQAGGIVK